ncbi:MAG: hypothetical protein GXO43_06860 [Crenarchaeota archaeon]|nr:hypothetical protein [Thermoproteota archaeon]
MNRYCVALHMLWYGCNIVFGAVTVDPVCMKWGRVDPGVGVIFNGYLFNHVVILK